MLTSKLISKLIKGHLEEAASCLSAGADPNVLSADGAAAMHIAAGVGVDAVRLLLINGGDPNVRSADGSRPLHVAAAWGDRETLKLLLQNGANPNVTDQEGQRPVDVARSEDHLECADLLRYYSMLVAIGEEEEKPGFTEEPADIHGNYSSYSLSPPACKQYNAPLSNSSSDEDDLNVSEEYSQALSHRLSRLLHSGKGACLDVTSPDCPYLGQKYEPLGSDAANRTILATDYPLLSDSSDDSIVCTTEKEIVDHTPFCCCSEVKTVTPHSPPRHTCLCHQQTNWHSCGDPNCSCLDMQRSEILERKMRQKYFPDLQSLDCGAGCKKCAGASGISNNRSRFSPHKTSGVQQFDVRTSPCLGAVWECKTKKPVSTYHSPIQNVSNMQCLGMNSSSCSRSLRSASKSLWTPKSHLFCSGCCQHETSCRSHCSHELSPCKNCHHNFPSADACLTTRHLSNSACARLCPRRVHECDTGFTSSSHIKQPTSPRPGSPLERSSATHTSKISQQSFSCEKLPSCPGSKSLSSIIPQTTHHYGNATCRRGGTPETQVLQPFSSFENKSPQVPCTSFQQQHTSMTPDCKKEAAGPRSPVTLMPVLFSPLHGPGVLSKSLFTDLCSQHLAPGFTFCNDDNDDGKQVGASQSSHSVDSGYCTSKMLSPAKLPSVLPDSLAASSKFQTLVQKGEGDVPVDKQPPILARTQSDIIRKISSLLKDADDLTHVSLLPSKEVVDADPRLTNALVSCSNKSRNAELRDTRQTESKTYVQLPGTVKKAEVTGASAKEKKTTAPPSSGTVSKNAGKSSSSGSKARESLAELSVSSVDTNDSFQTCQEAVPSEANSIINHGSQPESSSIIHAESWARESSGFDVSAVTPDTESPCGSAKDNGHYSLPGTASEPLSKAQDAMCGTDKKNGQDRPGYKPGAFKPPRKSRAWSPPTGALFEDSDLMTSDDSFISRSKQNAECRRPDTIGSNNVTRWLQNLSIFPSITNTSSSRKKSRVSEDSLLSTSSVKEYIYRDKEKGVTLLERHIPSECSSSSRASLESASSMDSEATIAYDWKDASTSETQKLSRKSTGSISDFSLTAGHTMESECSHVEKSVSHVISVDGKKPQTESCGEKSTGRAESCKEMIASENTSGSSSYSEGPEGKVEIPAELEALSNEAIFQSLKELGESPGPVQTGTRQTYLRRLASLRSGRAKLSLDTSPAGYSSELNRLLAGSMDLEELAHTELLMVAQFQTPGSRTWREGNIKSCFNYLLLDPRVTRNLPLRAKSLSDLEGFKTFLLAVFYIGKGKRSRPYCHLYEAISQLNSPKQTVSKKIQQILDVWASNQGVISLHCFQNVIPVEAYTREACMVDAIGLDRLTNVKRGDYYGISSTWPAAKRRAVGAFLLRKAYQIFLSEGERQISPVDIKRGR